MNCPICSQRVVRRANEQRPPSAESNGWGPWQMWLNRRMSEVTFGSQALLAAHMETHGWVPRGTWSKVPA